jgi:hypothetical protein
MACFSENTKEKTLKMIGVIRAREVIVNFKDNTHKLRADKLDEKKPRMRVLKNVRSFEVKWKEVK